MIADFPYGDHEKLSAPRSIDRERLTNSRDKLGQSGQLYFLRSVATDHYEINSASQMWLLGRLLPLMVGDLVPEDDLKIGSVSLAS